MDMLQTAPPYCSLGNLLHCFTCVDFFILTSCWSLVQLQFTNNASCFVTVHLSKEPGSIFSLISYQVLGS